MPKLKRMTVDRGDGITVEYELVSCVNVTRISINKGDRVVNAQRFFIQSFPTEGDVKEFFRFGGDVTIEEVVDA